MTQDVHQVVDRELDAVLASDAGAARRTGAAHRDLLIALRDAARGGKRVRPRLLLAAHDALGGRRRPAAERAAAALELLHTGFVLHDDVIDRDDRRRGRPNIPGQVVDRALRQGLPEPLGRRGGEAAGILAGDLALLIASRMVATAVPDPDITADLLDLLEETVHATVAGELDDVLHGIGLAEAPLGVEGALAVGARKTAVYSFEFPLRVGALLADAPAEVQDRLGAVGQDLGIGFQLVDDLLGVFGDPGITGKSVLTDLREGTVTPLVAQARTTGRAAELDQLLGDPALDEDGAARARRILEDCGARSATEELVAEHLERARSAAASPGLPAVLAAEVAAVVAEIREEAAGTLPPSRAGRSTSTVVGCA